MDASASMSPNPAEEPSRPYAMFIMLLTFAIGIYIAIENGASALTVGTNWPENRCQPQYMLLAGLFGHDVNENFQFCLNQIIQDKTKGATGPFASGMMGFTGILSNLMDSANSFRVTLATLVGGILKIISEFQARFTALASRIKITAVRMKVMMNRVYGMMFSIIYMGLSAVTGVLNFGDSFVFKFVDTFCFPPETAIALENGVVKPISEIELGDFLEGGHRVTSVYQFAADGQEMVRLGSVEVSSNHFVQFSGRWIAAKDHPDAYKIADWSGGTTRPLICLSTEDHIIDLQGFRFADYDETEEGNGDTQDWINASLNGGRRDGTSRPGTPRPGTPYPETSSDIGVSSTTKIKTLNGLQEIGKVELGTYITKTDRVVGIQRSLITDVSKLPSGQIIGSGTLVWIPQTNKWIRAGNIYGMNLSYLSYQTETVSLFVSPGANYELEDGTIVRDAMEVYSPETKKAYAEKMLAMKLT
jgi:hypothetical protein